MFLTIFLPNYCSLTSLKIPQSVTSIGQYAFYFCAGLTSINIPEGVTSIGDYTFYECWRLTSINIPEGVTSIGPGAFNCCRGLTSINIPKSVKYIGYAAFENCSDLTAVFINDLTAWCNIDFIDLTSNPLSYGHNLYLNKEILTTLTIPEDITSIHNAAFYGCSSITSITIHNGVTSIGEKAFGCCSGLVSINIPDGITSIGDMTFYKCSSLTSLTIPESVTSIGKTAFFGCTNLVSINIPDGITSIEQDVFYGCSGLTSITIPNGVTSIGQHAFDGCSGLTSFYCSATEPPTCDFLVFNNVNLAICKLYVPDASLSKYSSTSPWSEFTNIIGVYETCEAPTITFDNDAKKLVFASATEGAECHYSVSSEDMTTDNKGNEATITGVYTITAYASADGMYNSEKTSAKLVWVSAAIEGDGILKAKADRGVVVYSNADQIYISGTIGGETIEVFNVGGLKVKALKVSGNDTTINGLQSGNVYIVKIGGTNVKVAL